MTVTAAARTYDLRFLFLAKTSIWVWWKLAKGIVRSGIYLLFVIGGCPTAAAINVLHDLLHVEFLEASRGHKRWKFEKWEADL